MRKDRPEGKSNSNEKSQEKMQAKSPKTAILILYNNNVCFIPPTKKRKKTMFTAKLVQTLTYIYIYI